VQQFQYGARYATARCRCVSAFVLGFGYSILATVLSTTASQQKLADCEYLCCSLLVHCTL
jgi:hypothetical protein